MANSHLVVLKRPYLDAILAGRKTVESRFMKTERAPFGKIATGDRLFFKASSGPVRATGRAGKVMDFENLTPKRVERIKRTYNGRIVGSEEYWAEKSGSKCGVLVWLEEVKAIEPVWIDKRDWRAWVVLMAEKDFGLLDG